MEAARRQEIYYLQKSRIQWLREGDRNTRFFHALITHRYQSDYTSLLKVYDHDTSHMQEAEIAYFLTHQEIEDIMTIPTREVIQDVVFSMSRNRTPRPDGFPTDFYTSCWDIVGTNIVHAVKEFFSTFITLIPKVTNPTSFRDFRPISLCNVCYKVVSKIITIRLRTFLDRLISPEQCRFVKGCHIHDNIMLVHELTQSFDQDIRGSNVIIKLDMEKAFDRIE
ncbi:unnamed protein product [Spirodela intermedia]|uniref:Uncharacterized protein n=2 Tax=Spirodela intermedia TaxID=51605 RepID=A0A7I8KNZ7_SPIIN|nr:unnamed protein product [Spirodela intermedia]CAA7398818.1 unnamed protein product [Spirodela intermedia]